MRWLKSLVVVLGILIAAGVTLLAYGFVRKAQDPEWRLVDIFVSPPAKRPPATQPAPPGAAVTAKARAPIAPFGTIDLGLPDGCVVVDVAPARKRAYLTIGPPGPCHRVVVVDIAAGRILGTIRLGP